MLNKIFHVLAYYIKSKNTVVLGISGGPDSTALFHLLTEFFKQTPCRIIVAHVNHGIRGRAADQDEEFVQKLAENYHLIYEAKQVKLIGKSAIEERGRKIRRDFFEYLRKKYKARWILTAHTQDDQIETILFNFLRGSGPAGLGGMKLTEGYYLKPLLGIPKSEILIYLKSRKLLFCRDTTNEDIRFRRNFMRKKIIPLLEHINSSFRKVILRNAVIFRALDEWVFSEAQLFLSHFKTRSFEARDFRKLTLAIQQKVLQIAFQKVAKNHYCLPFVKIEEILRMISRNVGRKRIITGKGGVTFSLSGGRVKIKACL